MGVFLAILVVVVVTVIAVFILRARRLGGRADGAGAASGYYVPFGDVNHGHNGDGGGWFDGGGGDGGGGGS